MWAVGPKTDSKMQVTKASAAVTGPGRPKYHGIRTQRPMMDVVNLGLGSNTIPPDLGT